MREYNHLTLMDREKLFLLSSQGYGQAMIAERIGFSQSAVSRELRRNRNKVSHVYEPFQANLKASSRKVRGCKIDKNQQLKDHIYSKLELGWSPDVISKRLKLESGQAYVSHETIYQHIYQPAQRKLKSYKLLTRHKSKRGPRKTYTAKDLKMKDKISIHNRPPEINDRASFGHWEGDLMIGKNSKSQVLTLQERKSRFLIIKKLPSKNAVIVNAKITDLGKNLKAVDKIPFLTVTFDNGTEFNEFKELQKTLGIGVYFCDPYASWQKGGIENANGIIRRTIPKKSDFNHYSDRDIDDLMWNINTTPRKCLGYKTPYEVIANEELVLSRLGKPEITNYALAN
jgi:IS30 family transposase